MSKYQLVTKLIGDGNIVVHPPDEDGDLHIKLTGVGDFNMYISITELEQLIKNLIDVLAMAKAHEAKNEQNN